MALVAKRAAVAQLRPLPAQLAAFCQRHEHECLVAPIGCRSRTSSRDLPSHGSYTDAVTMNVGAVQFGGALKPQLRPVLFVSLSLLIGTRPAAPCSIVGPPPTPSELVARAEVIARVNLRSVGSLGHRPDRIHPCAAGFEGPAADRAPRRWSGANVTRRHGITGLAWTMRSPTVPRSRGNDLPL